MRSNDLEHHSRGCGSWNRFFTWWRWGGGAEPGTYHVHLALSNLAKFPGLCGSVLAVVDDFGDLVQVRS